MTIRIRSANVRPYDVPATPPLNYLEFIEKNMILPRPPRAISINQLIVSVLFYVKPDGGVYNLAIEKEPKFNVESWTYTSRYEFRAEALRLIKELGCWIPSTFNGEYVNNEVRVFVKFRYHPMCNIDAKTAIELNPDQTAEFLGDKENLQQVTSPGAFDGFVTFIVIIELTGRLSHPVPIESGGRIQLNLALEKVVALEEWKPASKEGRPVISQKIITIYI